MINLEQPNKNLKKYEEEIETRFKDVSYKDAEYSCEDIKELINWIQVIPPEFRQNKACKLAQILLETFRKFPNWEQERTNEELCTAVKEGIEMLALVDGASGSYIECVQFLNNLYKESGKIKKVDLAQKFLSFKDIIVNLKGLFLLEDEEKRRIFPIHELVSSLAKDFKCDNKHLINLAIAQQMFEKVKEYEKIKDVERIKKEITEIAQKHKIAFLNHLAKGGKLFIEEADYRENGTLITKLGQEVIIRNLKKSYFTNFKDINVESEINDLAHFVKIQLSPNEELTDFREIITEGTVQDKLDILKIVDEQKIYNIFIQKRIVRDRNTKKFVRFLNFGSDNKIIYNNLKEEYNREGFINVFGHKETGLRAKTLYKNGGDILTVDFYCAFYREVVKEDWELYSSLENKKDDFYQRNLISEYLNYVLKKNDSEQTESLIERLYNFSIKYFNYMNFNEETSINDKLFAFPLFAKMPGELKKENWLEKKKMEIFNTESDRWEVKELIYSKNEDNWLLDDKNIENFKILDLDNEEQSSSKLPKGNVSVYFCSESNEIIYDKNINTLIGKIDFLNKINKKEVIKYGKDGVSCNSKTKKFIKIMMANNFSEKYLKIFQCGKEDNETFCFYKLFWHFQIFKFNEEKIEKFFYLMLDKHYTYCVENKDAIESYFENLSVDEQGVLIIAKESYGNESTLNYLFEKYGRKLRKNTLSWSFDAGLINKNLHFDKEKNIYLWRKKPLKKIIFLADNLMKGASLKKMLDYHLKSKDTPERNYLRIENSIKEIREKQEVDIEVHVIFGYTSSVEEIERNYDVKIKISKEIPENFKVDNEMKEIAKELYNKDIEECCCIYRFNNPPNKTIFSKTMPYILDPQKYVGLFERKREIK